MDFARAIIATVLATGLITIVILREITTGEAVEGGLSDGEVSAASGDLFGQLDATFLMLAVAIIILTVPDAISYVRRKKKPSEDPADD